MRSTTGGFVSASPGGSRLLHRPLSARFRGVTMNAARLILLALALLAPVTYAGKLDDALLDKGLKLLTDLRMADVKTVGVLPFLVKRGAAPAGRDFAPL